MNLFTNIVRIIPDLAVAVLPLLIDFDDLCNRSPSPSRPILRDHLHLWSHYDDDDDDNNNEDDDNDNNDDDNNEDNNNDDDDDDNRQTGKCG